MSTNEGNETELCGCPEEPHTCESAEDRLIADLEEQNEALESRLRAAEEAVETLPPFDANDGDAYSIAPRIAHAGAEIACLNADLLDARGRIAELEAENAKLTERRQELLETVKRISQTTPFPDEAKGWESQRAVLLARDCTFRAQIAELERDIEGVRAENRTLRRHRDLESAEVERWMGLAEVTAASLVRMADGREERELATALGLNPEAKETKALRWAGLIERVRSDCEYVSSFSPFTRNAADALADEVAVLVRLRVIDSHSPAGDALLDYRNPPPTQRSDRIATLERQLEFWKKENQRLRGIPSATGAAELHADENHPDYEYETTTGQRKAFYNADVPPDGEGWIRNVHRGLEGWARLDEHEESYWMRYRPRPAPDAARRDEVIDIARRWASFPGWNTALVEAVQRLDAVGPRAASAQDAGAPYPKVPSVPLSPTQIDDLRALYRWSGLNGSLSNPAYHPVVRALGLIDELIKAAEAR